MRVQIVNKETGQVGSNGLVRYMDGARPSRELENGEITSEKKALTCQSIIHSCLVYSRGATARRPAINTTEMSV